MTYTLPWRVRLAVLHVFLFQVFNLKSFVAARYVSSALLACFPPFYMFYFRMTLPSCMHADRFHGRFRRLPPIEFRRSIRSLTLPTHSFSAGHGANCVRELPVNGTASVLGEEAGHDDHDDHDEHDDLLGEEHGDDHDDDGYNLTLAIVSIFVLWVVSFAGAAYPLLLKLSRHPYIVMSIRLGSFAGSGVMLATAFVHMLYTANENLSSNCLPESWLDAYGPWAFLFACLTIIVLQTIDYVLYLFVKPVGGNSRDGRDAGNLVMDDTEVDRLDKMESAGVTTSGLSSRTVGNEGISDASDCKSHTKCKDEDCNSRVLLGSSHKDKPKGALLSNLIISEVSIGVHSLVIGLSLGLTGSSEFVALFVAIIFHQLLEGVALGSATAESGLGNRIVLLFATIYSITTPVGIAIGIAVRTSLDTSSPAMLYTVGILDSIAAGALIYLALADHMNALRVHAKWMRRSTPAIQTACFAAFYIGATILLVLALWA